MVDNFYLGTVGDVLGHSLLHYYPPTLKKRKALFGCMYKHSHLSTKDFNKTFLSPFL